MNQQFKSFLSGLKGKVSGFLKVRVFNPWTISNAPSGSEDIGKWQVGYKDVDNCLIVGVFDHLIEAENNFSNMLKDSDSLLAESV